MRTQLVKNPATAYSGEMLDSLIGTVKTVDMKAATRAAMLIEFRDELERHKELLRAGKIEDLGEEMRRGR